MEVAKLDMTNNSHQCPPGTTQRTYQSKRLCGRGITSVGCSSTMFSAHGFKYSQVCGKIIAYQDKTPDAFRRQQVAINSHYVDGISLTHGRNPTIHIWTFAAALDEVGTAPNASSGESRATEVPMGSLGNETGVLYNKFHSHLNSTH